MEMLRKALTPKKKKNWIAGAIKHPGALHRELGIKAGHKIPAKTLAKAASKGGKLGARARLAETLKGFHHGKHYKADNDFMKNETETLAYKKHRKHRKKIEMEKGEAIREHEHLTKVLKTGKGMKSEAKKQERELKEYRKAKKHKHYKRTAKDMRDEKAEHETKAEHRAEGKAGEAKEHYKKMCKRHHKMSCKMC